ncbi:MAG: hypothetical protein KA986_00505 [Aliarcobacter sp.]|nr:hypothetical protein [Aliarcobacter sp.]MBP9766099.1 hypothetical protein [Candidatus Paceibacterota bacterium]
MEIKRIVVWGLRNRWHTHRFIHKAFYENAKKLGYEVLWLEDEKKNAKYVESGDLVIFSEVIGKMVSEKFKIEDYHLPITEGVYYCLHNVKEIFYEKINKKYLLHLEKYQNDFDNLKGNEIWNIAVYFNLEKQTLFQPWGTDLLDYEFKKPVFRKNKFIFWVGSVWNDNLNQGNFLAIEEFKMVLKKFDLKFLKVRFVPDWMNVFFIRLSRLSPAIAGAWQVKHDYLPCRMFKNISYGQVGFSNVEKFNEILNGCNIEGSMEDMVKQVLKLNEKEYKNLVLKQQEMIKKYTYKNALENIFSAFNIIEKNN